MYKYGYDSHDFTGQEILRFVYNNLPEINDDNFSNYDVSIYYDYDSKNREYKLISDVRIINSIKSTITIPNPVINMNKMSEIQGYLTLLVDDLTGKITGIPVDRDYFELNGVKYYPKDEGE